MAALHQQDVVDVGAGGGLVQGQAAKTDVSGKVFVQHSSSWKVEFLSQSNHTTFVSALYLSSKASSSRTSRRRPP